MSKKQWLISLAICIVGIELVSRFFMGNFAQSALVEIIDDPALCLRLGKNRQLTYTGWWLKTVPSDMASNAFGSREPRTQISNTSLSTQANTNTNTKIFFLGDSFVYGQGVDQKDSLPAQIQVLQPKLDIWNFGVPGRDFFQFSSEMELLAQQKPDVIIINIFANDFLLPPNTCMFTSAAKWQFPIMRNCYICRLGLFSWYMIQDRPQPSPQSLEPSIIEHIDVMNNISKKNNIQFIVAFLVDQGTFQHEVPHMPNLKSIFEQRNIPIIDLSQTWISMQPFPQKYFIPNEQHFTPIGNQVMAREYAKQLSTILTQDQKVQ